MIVQAFIAITELFAIFLLQDKRESHRKFAPIFGLLGQPFWFYSSYEAEQWGAFILCFFFFAAWVKAFKEYWIDEKKMSPEEYLYLISDAVDKIGGDNRLDYKDYVKRVAKEALGSR